MRKDKLIILLLAAGTSVPIDAQSAAQQPPRGVTEEMRIVSSDVIPGMQLTRVSDLQVNDAGLVFVAHGSEYLVRVFDQAGKLLNSFGRKGQGPGEWRGAFDLFGTIGDTILVRDQNTWDLNFYLSDGKLARTWSARSPSRRVMAYYWNVVLSGNSPSFSVRVPAGARVFQVASDKFWAVTPDSNDLPIIARYRISAR